MRNTKIILILVLVFSIISITGCTTKPPEEIMGKWTQQMKYVDSEYKTHTIKGSTTTLFFDDDGLLIVGGSFMRSEFQVEMEYKFIDKTHFELIFDDEKTVYKILKLDEHELLYIQEDLDPKKREGSIERYKR